MYELTINIEPCVLCDFLYFTWCVLLVSVLNARNVRYEKHKNAMNLMYYRNPVNKYYCVRRYFTAGLVVIQTAVCTIHILR